MQKEQYVRDVETVPGFALYEHTHGYPLLVRDERGGTIHGELWEISDRTLARLDDMEGAAGYERAQITLSDGSIVETYIWSQLVPNHFKACGNKWVGARRAEI